MRPSSPQKAARSHSKLESISTVASRHRSPVYVSEPAINEQAALSVVQRWLHVPTTATEDELVAASSSNTNTRDPVFLSEPTFDEQLGCGSRTAWRRVTGVLYCPSPHHTRLVKGCLQGSLWFLGAVAAVSCKRELLLDLIVSDEQAPRGLYTFQFHKQGAWRRVVVDNRLPCVEEQQRLAFCSSGQAQELWPSLLEKAYARLHGGFAALSAGSVGNALVDLTGGVMAAKVNLHQEQQMADAAAGLLWSQIVQWLTAGSIIACMSKQQPEQPPGLLHGILANAPYSILAAKALGPSGTKLLRLHCPWAPEGVWQGAWGPASPEWDAVDLQSDATLAAGLEDEATFWCSYWDFIQMFNRCWVLQLPPHSWHQLRVSAGWVGASAGGPPAPAPGPAPDSSIASSLQALTCDPRTHRASSPAAAAAAAGAADLAVSGQLHSQHQRRLVPAGGPVCVSSSWCCNPQFQLTVAGSSEVVVCLSQLDLHVQQKAHTHKRKREFQISLAVMLQQQQQQQRPATTGGRRSPSPAAALNRQGSPARAGTASASGRLCSSASSPSSPSSGRLWVPAGLVADSGPASGAREVVVRFRAVHGRSYLLVPSTGRAGDTGPFVIRVFSPSPMQLEQLPTPLSLVIGGVWAGGLAGGSSCHATFGSNPQYLLSVQRETTAVFALLRPDISNSLLPPDFSPEQCVGLTLCSPEVAPDGLGRRTAVRHPATEVFAASKFDSMSEAVLLVRLQPETPYVLVPSTAAPGIEAPFELRLLSSQPIELVALPEVRTVSHTGAWTSDSAGGCNLHATWPTNPAFHLALQRRAPCRIVVTRLKGSWRRNQPLGELIGFYLIKPSAAAASPGQRSTAALKQMQLFESAFVPCDAAEAELELPPGPLLLVPCTFSPVAGRFAVSVTAACPFDFQPAGEGSLAAAAAAAAASGSSQPNSRSGSPSPSSPAAARQEQQQQAAVSTLAGQLPPVAEEADEVPLQPPQAADDDSRQAAAQHDSWS